MVYSINGLIGHVVNERGIGTTYDRKCPKGSFGGTENRRRTTSDLFTLYARRRHTLCAWIVKNFIDVKTNCISETVTEAWKTVIVVRYYSLPPSDPKKHCGRISYPVFHSLEHGEYYLNLNNIIIIKVKYLHGQQ